MSPYELRQMPRPIARPAQVKDTDKNGFTADDLHALERLPSMEKTATSYSMRASAEKDDKSSSQEYLKHPDTTTIEQARDGLLYRDGLLVKQPAPTKVCSAACQRPR